ncbi:hypothetical protein J2W42_006569 [Rhizobium tibeticum]|nr:hypothetical protein [Rhizobium tibeticum]
MTLLPLPRILRAEARFILRQKVRFPESNFMDFREAGESERKRRHLFAAAREFVIVVLDAATSILLEHLAALFGGRVPIEDSFAGFLLVLPGRLLRQRPSCDERYRDNKECPQPKEQHRIPPP